MKGLYNSARIAAGYAFARPPVHERMLERVRHDLGLRDRVQSALDVGCGAGRSTAALQPLAHRVVGVEPAAAMLAHCHAVAPHARFVVGTAEQLPFPPATFDLVTAAGAINYTDVGQSLQELARVLRRTGAIIIYDFSAGRRFAEDMSLEQWYEEFDRRWPNAPGYARDVRTLPFDAAGLALASFSELAVTIEMSAEAYSRYAMSETRVELARASGEDESAIEHWCAQTLVRLFGDRSRDVVFDGYIACVRHGHAS
jgi:ubiquinone/menaquinone biosynthesis C-methylase UbiE